MKPIEQWNSISIKDWNVQWMLIKYLFPGQEHNDTSQPELCNSELRYLMCDNACECEMRLMIQYIMMQKVYEIFLLISLFYLQNAYCKYL